MPFLVGPNVDVGDASVLAPPVASPPPQLAPPPPPPIVAAPSRPILPAGQVYFDAGAGTFIGSTTGQVISSPPVGDGSAEPDDFAAADAAAYANDPDLAGLPDWELADPFGLQFFSVSNPPLKGGDATDAIVQACSTYGVDPLACLANALHEGASGAIGDTGTAYGPFQIHATDGRLPQFKGKGPSSAAVNAWAWTQNGLEYAVRSMVNGRPSAKGLTGHAAVHAIVDGFERPFDARGAKITRDAEYDSLKARGAAVWAYVASKLAGPAAGGAIDTGIGSAPAPPAATYVPAGVNAQWRGLVNVFGTTIPEQHDKVKSFGLTLKDVFK